jgi:hypothetical protein
LSKWTLQVGGDAEQVHPAPVDLDHEKHVEAPEENRVDGEEVGCQDAFGLGTQELAPGRTEAPWRGWEAMATKNSGDARLRDCDVEFLELAHDAQVAPARTLPRQVDDQFDSPLGQSGTAGPPVKVGPSSSNEVAVPAEAPVSGVTRKDAHR